jgi:hypothetical protein
MQHTCMATHSDMNVWTAAQSDSTPAPLTHTRRSSHATCFASANFTPPLTHARVVTRIHPTSPLNQPQYFESLEQTMVEMRAIVTSVVLALAALPTAHSLPSRVVVDAPLRTRTKQTTVKVFIIAGQSNAVGMAETNSTNHTTGQPQNGSLIYQVRPPLHCHHCFYGQHCMASTVWAASTPQASLHRATRAPSVLHVDTHVTQTPA